MNKKHLTVKKLGAHNLKDVMQLQQKIIDGLHPDEQHFILHRTEEDYMKSLNSDNSNMLGVFDGDELIAQTVFAMPKNGEKRDMPELKSDVPNEDLVLYEAILVNPQYRGSGLMKKMLDFIEDHAIDNGRKQAIIQIAIDNPASWINALHHGMSITKVDRDPSDGVKVVYLEKKIVHKPTVQPTYSNQDSYSLFLGENIHKKIPALFSKMQYLIESGYHGVELNKETQSLIWKKQSSGRTQAKIFDWAVKQKKDSKYAY